MGHRHRWDRLELRESELVYVRGDREVVTRQETLHLVCSGCGRAHRDRVALHEWRRPGRAGAHGRPVRCGCHGIELPLVVTATCGTHGEGEHTLVLKSGGRLQPRCRACAADEAAGREIDPEIARAAARRYWAQHGEARRRERGARAKP